MIFNQSKLINQKLFLYKVAILTQNMSFGPKIIEINAKILASEINI